MSKTMIPDSDPKRNIREKPHSAGVGNERKADMSVVGDTSLKGTMAALEGDLRSGNPHIPLHGLKPTGRM